MNKTVISSGTLTRRSPPPELAKHVIAFVHRDEDPGRQLVRVLPEVRASIQIMTAEPYWLRDAAVGASWRRLPRIALWGPRYHWCYGYAAGHIYAHAIGLNAAALRALSPKPAAALVDQVLDLSALHGELAAALDPQANAPFDAWRIDATKALLAFFETRPLAPDPIEPTLPILATAESKAVALAAAHAGLSERQYRRVFARSYGVSPKRYQRAVRVDRMIRQLHDAPWEHDAFHETPIAFADQPHAIREFRSVTGLTPSEYVRIKRRGGATLRSVPTTDVSPPDF